MTEYKFTESKAIITIDDCLKIDYDLKGNFINRLLRFKNQKIGFDKIVVVYNEKPSVENASGLIEIRVNDNKMHGNHYLFPYSNAEINTASLFVEQINKVVKELKNK